VSRTDEPVAIRKGARRRSEIPGEILDQLNAGITESRTLVEGLAVNFALLLRAAAPELGAADLARIESVAALGITRRMTAVGELLLTSVGIDGFQRFAAHRSDTVRGWAAYLIGSAPDLPLSRRLQQVRPLADDRHFGVREWAWLALRPHIAAETEAAIQLLQPWTEEASSNLRRFAVEATRPRGVWATHIEPLKQRPSLGLPLLEPLRADPESYVQDSVANWLNDASKLRPEWVSALCDRWRSCGQDAATERICKRALRGVNKHGGVHSI